MSIFIGNSEIKNAYIWTNSVKEIYVGTTKVRPSSQPITEIGIYWSEADGVISFQTSAGNGISIADKNLGATQVYNSGDTLSFANMGYAYQWGNNYGWQYNVNPTSTSTTKVNAGNYGPGNYYSSSTFIYYTNSEVQHGYYWDSSNNANLRGGTTNTYIARRGPCAEGWHIPSSADCQTLINAISTITGSVNGTKIKQYCKLVDNLPGIMRDTATWGNIGWSGILKSDVYSNIRAGLLYLPTNGSYNNNEYYAKSQAMPIKPFSNTFIQPTNKWTKLN